MKFSELKIGAGFRFTGYKPVCVKRSGNTFYAPNGSYWDCSIDIECNLETKGEITMKFKDLEVGTQFYFVSHRALNVKHTSHTYQAPDGNIFGCDDWKECTKRQTMKFKDLAIGAKFRYTGCSTICTKRSDSTCITAGGTVWNYNVNAECIPETLMFEDLDIGAKFRFPEDTEHHVKTTEGTYSTTLDQHAPCVSRIKCIPETLTFEDLEIGTKFRFTGCNSICTKRSKTTCFTADGNLWGIPFDVGCVKEDDTKAFSELKIGSKFKFVNGTTQHVKMEENLYCMMPAACTMSCDVEVKCVIEQTLTFDDLVVGAKFKFDGKGREFIKTWPTSASTIVKDVDAVVERSGT